MNWQTLFNTVSLSSNALLVAALLVIALLVWVAGWLGQGPVGRAQPPASALGQVMAATVSRRNLKVTLGQLLETTVQSLSAQSGVLHLLDEETDCFRLLYAVEVVQLNWLTIVATSDPLLTQLQAEKEGLLICHLDDPYQPWSALAGPPSRVLASVRINRFASRQPKPVGVITLGFSSPRVAQASRDVLLAIGRYASQVLNEFEDLEQRARDVQALSAELQSWEALTRTTAHDLLNQLTHVYGALTTSLVEGRLVAADVELLEPALAQLALVNQMVTDLRDPDRPLQAERIPVEALVELAAGMLAGYPASLPIEFSIQVPTGLPDVWGERIEILRVLDNLLTNAVRHNSEALPVHIWLRAELASEGAEVMFEVGDDGVGISPEAQATLFELDILTDSAGLRHGHGLGLWSCRRIIEAHGGCLWVESRPDEGARFWFTLPVYLEANASRPEGERNEAECVKQPQRDDIERPVEQESLV